MKKKKYPELSALKGRMREKGVTYRDLSQNIKMGLNTLNDKLNGYSILNADEVELIVSELEIEPVDIIKYFFPRMLRNETNLRR